VEAARYLAPGGLFARMSEWQQQARPSERGGMLGRMAEHVNAWRDELAARHRGHEVWPVVVVDPLQRWQDPELGEVEALNSLAEDLDALADEHGWIVLLSSDTNKASAAATAGEEGNAASIFRGSYKLFHACDALLLMKAERIEKGAELPPTRRVTVEIAKNRNGPAWGEAFYEWHPASGRFEPREAERDERPSKPSPTSAPVRASPSGTSYGID